MLLLYTERVCVFFSARVFLCPWVPVCMRVHVCACLQSVKKQRVAEAAVDSMKLQMAELCRSDTLSRAREQHDRDLAAMREQHEARALALQQSLDSLKQALEEKVRAHPLHTQHPSSCQAQSATLRISDPD